MELTQFKESRLGPVTNPTKDLYVTSGNRLKAIGSQNGMFPDFGGHVKDEMGGIWVHPIKLMDGFWVRVGDDDKKMWLEEATAFHNYPFYTEHEYDVPELQLKIVRRQYCPDDLQGMVVSLRITDEAQAARNLQVSFLGRTDLSPVWLSDRLNIEDGDDDGYLDRNEGLFIGKDAVNPWYVAFGANRPFTEGLDSKELFGPERTAGKGVSGLLTYDDVEVKPGDTVEILFYIAGSYRSEQEARATFRTMVDEHEQLFECKRQRYARIVRQTNISIPDAHLEKVFNWVKFHNDWLVLEVPEIGRGFGAGHPEYSWWFGCDNSYAILGLLPVGNFELALDTLRLIHDLSEKTNGNGRIIHEASSNGVVFNPGNTQETPHFIKCVWDTFLWTGDIDFLKSMYPTVKKGICWLLKEMDPDGDLLPEGYGIMEVEGLNVELIDSAVYTYEALRVAALMAELFQETDQSSEYRCLALHLGDTINRIFWIEEEGLYGDCVATPANVLQRMDLYIERANKYGPNAVTDLEKMKSTMLGLDPKEQGAWLFKNWVINTPMEVGLAPRENAVRALDRMSTDEFTGPAGTYLNGMERTSMMTISTGVQAVAECRYGRMDEALRYVNLIAGTFNRKTPGSISEMSPDWGCFVQAWTNYGVTWPLMTYMFGIQPKAYWKQLTLCPRLPSNWDEMSVNNVRFGTGGACNTLDLSIFCTDREDVYIFRLHEAGWSITLDLAQAADARIVMDGEEMTPTTADNGNYAVTITESDAKTHEIRVIR